MAETVSRRDFLNRLGVTVGGVALGGPALSLARAEKIEAQEKLRGKIPDMPYKTAHMTFLSGPLAVLGEPSYKGHLLAAEEINAQGGLLGKRKIETIPKDEAAGTAANVTEFRRLKLSVGINLFTGIISSGNSPAIGPVAEELKVLTWFTDGCTDFLFDKAIPNPKYVFRVTNIQSADGVVAAIATALKWPEVRKIAHIHPDYAYGRNAFDHFSVAIRKLLPDTQIVSEGWPKLGATEFTAHISKIIGAKPDLLVTSVWGGDYIAFYKQALRYGLFEKMKVTANVAFGVAPHVIGKDHPEGIIGGLHSNYYFLYPSAERWPLNGRFVRRYFERWKEYPNYEAEGAYTALYLVKLAIEKANKLTGGWPDDEAIITQLEGLSMAGPAGYIHVRSDNHQAYKDGVNGFSKHLPEYPFAVIDPNTVISVPIRNITAPPGWPKKDPTATYTWIEDTWPKVSG